MKDSFLQVCLDMAIALPVDPKAIATAVLFLAETVLAAFLAVFSDDNLFPNRDVASSGLDVNNAGIPM